MYTINIMCVYVHMAYLVVALNKKQDKKIPVQCMYIEYVCCP